MNTQAHWLLATALCAGACAGSKPSEKPDVTWREPAPAVVPLETEPTAHTTPRPAAATPERTASAEHAVIHRPAAPNAAHDSSAMDDSSATAEADNTKVADNTKLNERGRDEQPLTPMDQGEGENDLKITQRIRQAVVDDDSLSFTAKNVKIITVDGKVTLRGPVASSKERTTIGAAAKKVAGVARVDNQLEIEK